MITCRVEAVDIVDVLVLLGEDILRTTRSLSQPWDYMLTGVLMVVKHHAAGDYCLGSLHCEESLSGAGVVDSLGWTDPRFHGNFSV